MNLRWRWQSSSSHDEGRNPKSLPAGGQANVEICFDKWLDNLSISLPILRGVEGLRRNKS